MTTDPSDKMRCDPDVVLEKQRISAIRRELDSMGTVLAHIPENGLYMTFDVE